MENYFFSAVDGETGGETKQAPGLYCKLYPGPWRNGLLFSPIYLPVWLERVLALCFL